MTVVAPGRVCVVVGRTRHKMMQAELAEAAKRGHTFVEVRLDFLAKAVDFKRLLSSKACPWMATLRRPQDGGRWAGSEVERLTLLRQAIVSGAFDWVDLETDIAGIVPRFGPVRRVVSYHNVKETPDNLAGIYADMLRQDGDIYKVAVFANTPADCARVLEIQRAAPKPTVAFCIGDIGLPTRFTALKYGAPWTYAAFNRERGVAPGLPSVDELRTTYPVGRIDADTKIYGLLGDPVAHSYSPVLHNHMLGRLGGNAIYLPFRVPAGKLKEAVDTFADVPVSGYSVTIPHKEAALALAAEADPAATACGAANTLVRRPDGTFAASNSDHSAATASLAAHFAADAGGGPGRELSKLFVLVVGGGGAARAVAHALHAAGAAVTVSARNGDQAAKVAADVGCKVTDWQARHNVLPCDVLVNCTSVGMSPDTDQMPVHVSFLTPSLTVFDTVYTPENTLLIREARARGCPVVTGVDMFVRQAARQLELFTGKTPPIEAMRDLLRKAMSPLTRALDDEDADG